MVVVAVVGGTGGVGKTIVDALKADGKYEVIVLSRKAPQEGTTVPTFTIDYNNIDELSKSLDAHNVHTIISTIMMADPAGGPSEIKLVAAAAKSSSTKRFIASNWGLATPDDESLRLPFNISRDQTTEALRKTNLEWTVIHNGFFLDYFGMPHVQTYLAPLTFAIDIGNKTAAIPGSTGDEIISFTYTKDMAKFVVAALGLPKWDESMHCYSENASLNQLVKIAEEATGSKFDVTYDSIDKLYRGEVTELPSHKYAYPYIPKEFLSFLLSRFGLWTAFGINNVPKEGSLNEKFPEISTTSVKDIVGAWKGK